MGSKEPDITRADIHTAVYEEAASLASYQNLIAATREKLLRLHNAFNLFSGISRLPVEILARIFALSVESFRSYRVKDRSLDRSIGQVNAIAGVCSYWRNVAINTPSLWSYIDFDRMSQAELIPLWLERTRNCPLDIVSQSDIDLQPAVHSQIKYVRSIFIRIKNDSGDDWVSEWYNSGAPRTLTSLAIAQAQLHVSFPARNIAASREHLVDLFHSLSTLHLENVLVNWDLMECRSLVTLSLSWVDITAENIQKILSTNSKLQRIDLTDLNPSESYQTTILAPSVQLSQLRTLNLYFVYSIEWASILGMIVPGSHGLTLQLRCYDCDLGKTSNDLYVEFCRRSRIERLSCCSLAYLEDITTVASSLEVLTLRCIDFPKGFYDFFVLTSTDETHSPSLLFPHLHTLNLISCIFEGLEDLMRICSAYHFHEIGISDVLAFADGSRFSAEEFQDMIGPKTNVNILNKATSYSPFGVD